MKRSPAVASMWAPFFSEKATLSRAFRVRVPFRQLFLPAFYHKRLLSAGGASVGAQSVVLCCSHTAEHE